VSIVTSALEVSDGRALEVTVAGPADGPVVLFHMGTPSAGRPFDGWLRAGARRGLRHVFYARPGYGGSTRARGRSVAQCVGDVAQILDALDVERFYNVGWSGGGPHALACAALIPERVIATAVLAGVAPHDPPGLDWLAGMGEDNVAEFDAALTGEEALHEFLEPHRAEMVHVTGEQVADAFGDLISAVDRDALTGEFADFLAASMRGAVEQGVGGWLDDDLAFVRDWGFELAANEGPVAVWQGRHDLMVPFAHGRWLADNVPGARARLLEEHGHISLVTDAYGAVLDELLARGG
jgi:pimeloyl-ACP methyl ester carboxylesterase